jgi:hypothetical protein
MANDVAVGMGFSDMERLAGAIAKSGLFGIKTPEQALALMMISQAEGRHPALAARDYDIVQGRPAKKAEAMLRDFLQAGGKVEWHALTDSEAAATFSHPQGGTVRIDWNIDRGNKAQLTGKDNWKKFPRQMLRSRCVSEGVRTVWPMATSGMYVPEEAADAPPFTGTTIDAEPPERPAPSPPQAAKAPEPPAGDRYTDEKRAAWIVKLRAALATCRTVTEVEEIAERKPVLDFLDWTRANAPSEAAEVTAALAQAYGRIAAPNVQTPDDWDQDTGEIHINAEGKMAAG